MQEVIQEIGAQVINLHQEFLNFFPPIIGSFINFVILAILVVVYSIVIWNGYRFISKKDPLNLNLSKYNQITNPLSERLLAGVLYFIEYMIIIPVIILIVLGIFTFFLIILSPNENTLQIITISSLIIAAIRITAYYRENLSQDIAKFLPFMLLATFVLNPSFISQSDYIEKIILQLTEIPAFIGSMTTYLFFIIILEAILRLFDSAFSIFGINVIEEEKEGTEEKTNTSNN